MWRAAPLLLVLAACVGQTVGQTTAGSGAEPAGDGDIPVPAEEYVEVGGLNYRVEQATDWPVMALVVDPLTGDSLARETGRARTLLVFGAGDRATAIKVRSAACGKPFDLDAWDTEVVYRDPATGAYWFAGDC